MDTHYDQILSNRIKAGSNDVYGSTCDIIMLYGHYLARNWRTGGQTVTIFHVQSDVE